jgi:hypothetical protein
MADANFWRDLAKKFRKLDPHGSLRADWVINTSQPQQSLAHWTIVGPDPLRAEIQALARRGGVEIDPSADSLRVWLETLKVERINRSSEGSGIETDGTGTFAGHCLWGTISQVAQGSVHLCHLLESRALEVERRAKLEKQQRDNPGLWPIVVRQWEAYKAAKKIKSGEQEEVAEEVLRNILAQPLGCKPEDITWGQMDEAWNQLLTHYDAATLIPPRERRDEPPAPAIPEPESIGAQIAKLREECRLSIEALAEEIERDVTTVSRHESSGMIPGLSTIGAYERVFSKLLGRKVVINKTPRKRT